MISFVRSTRIPLAPLLFMLAVAGCSSSNPSSPTTIPPTSVGTFTQTDLVVGTGTVAANGNRLTVAYGGWLYDTSRPDGKGNSFDSGTGFQFTLGTGQVIRGWDMGVPGMRIGGQRRLIIPPDLAYGSQSNDRIPANATLVFDVTLLNVQ